MSVPPRRRLTLPPRRPNWALRTAALVLAVPLAAALGLVILQVLVLALTHLP